jgi:cobalamin biosynthesis Mg chelatase CobN
MRQKAADTAGSVALSPRPRDTARAAPENFDRRRTLSKTHVLDPAPSAETAQARVFESLLQAERAELLELARAGEALTDSDATDSPRYPGQIQTRLDEIHGLLRALRGRFPHPAPGFEG